MNKDINEGVSSQKKQVFNSNCRVDLNSACTLKKGILQLDADHEKKAIIAFESLREKPCFFIPASGSGSRMFQALFEWMEDGVARDEVDTFFELLNSFPFYKELIKNEKIDFNNKKQIVSYLLSDDGMNLAGIPKGLIPFHIHGNKTYNAIEEHALQAKDLFPNGCEVHFTIQKDFKSEIDACLTNLNLKGMKFTFSNQNEATDAYCFNAGQNLIEQNGVPLRRPAGHGALLQNLNALDNNLVLIKNVDNVQHGSKSNLSTNTWKNLIGVLLNFKTDLVKLSEQFSKESLKKWNDEYQILSPQEIAVFDEVSLTKLVSRPTRVCGMVKNEGEPGGGPFWVNNDSVTKQIIEKVQISTDSDQQEILKNSSHFNPVFMAISKSDVFDQELDLNDFVDDSKCLMVKKSYKGEPVFYRELPGLWNGSMSNWNTIFVEIPSEVFSPVKTINDLAKDAHKA